MWKRSALKKNVRISMRQSYQRTISVCFLIAMLTTAYPISTTFLNLQSAPSHLQDAALPLPLPNSEVIEETISNFLRGTPLINLFEGAVSRICSFVIDLFSTNFSLFFTVLRSINTFFAEHFSSASLFSAAGILLLFLYHIFVSNLLLVGEKRYFLESRSYKQTPISKILFLYKLRCFSSPVWIMLCRSVFQLLWNLTIIGGVIKHYEYIMIPYILAENPKISRRDAFFLSKQLMKHNKQKMFLLDLSFLGWRLLSLLTLGILDFVFINPYITACRAEVYAVLRRNYILSRAPRYETLNDPYLEQVLSEDELLISKALYDDSQGPYAKISSFVPEQYPVFLFKVQPPVRAVRNPLKVNRKYDVYSCLFLFFAFSIFGWALEVLLELMRSGNYEGNILLAGPWLPLYGAYGLLILLCTRRITDQPAAVFFCNFFLYAVLEYAANFIFDTVFGITLHDYSNFILNLNGRIYLGGCVVFSLIGCAFLYYLAPKWGEAYMKLGRPRRIFLSVFLCVLFAADIGFSLLLHVAFS